MPPRGTKAQADAYTGTLGELFVDTTAWQLRMSDGATVGGHVQGGISNLIGCSDVGIATGPALATGQYLRYLTCASPVLAAPVGSTTGGTLAAATYYYKVTALNSNGETLGSNEQSVTTTGSTSSVVLTWGAVANATGYNVYRGTAAGAESVYYAPGNVLTYTDTNAAPTVGTVPTSDTSSKWVNAALAWADLTGIPSLAYATRQILTSGALTGGGDLSADRTISISANGVTNALLAQMPTLTLKGNNTGGTANAGDLTAAQAKSLLAIAAGDVSGLAASATTDATNASNIGSGTLGAARLPALTGDVTTSVGTVATTIAAAAVTLAKMANLAASSIIGNNTSSAAVPVALSASQVKTLLALGVADVTGAAALTGATFTGTLACLPVVGEALVVEGVANQWTAVVAGYASTNQSFGMYIQAGTSSSDIALDIVNYNNTLQFFRVFGDGCVIVGPATYQGANTLNVFGTAYSNNGIPLTKNAVGAGTISAQSGGTASGGVAGDIIIIY